MQLSIRKEMKLWGPKTFPEQGAVLPRELVSKPGVLGTQEGVRAYFGLKITAEQNPPVLPSVSHQVLIIRTTEDGPNTGSAQV